MIERVLPYPEVSTPEFSVLPTGESGRLLTVLLAMTGLFGLLVPLRLGIVGSVLRDGALVNVAAGLAAATAWRAGNKAPNQRRAWRYAASSVTIAAAALTVGLVVDSAVGVAQLLWSLSLLASAVGLVGHVERGRRGSLLLDLSVGSAGVTALATVAWARTVASVRLDASGEVAVGLAAIAVGLALFAGTYPVLAGRRVQPVRWALFGGLALVGVGHVLGLNQGPPLPRAGAAAVVVGGFAAVGWAALLPQQPGRVRDSGEGWAQFFPLTGAIAALGILVAGQYGRLPLAAVVLAALTLVGAAARLLLTVGELRTLAVRRAEARTDELTGLPNRRAFAEHLRDQLHRRHPVRRAAVLLLDFDRFKDVNDSLGHGAGDELLSELGRRLAGVLYPGEFLCRLGGDEFAVFLDGGSDRSARSLAERLRRAAVAPQQVAGVTLRVDASVGIALWPGHGQTPEALLARADIAMYRAKAARTGVEVFSFESEAPTRERLQRTEALRQAILDGGVICHYQPKYERDGTTLAGVEALARWVRPGGQGGRGGQGGPVVVPPNDFIPLAEQAGLLPELTAVVLARSLAHLATWDDQSIFVPSVAVNVSASSLLQPGFAERVRAQLRTAALPGSRLVVEITEDTVIADPVGCARVLTELRAAGVGTSLDDYGTGYSSLALLRDLPLDEIKLDKSFGMQMCDDNRTSQIVASTVNLAHALGVRLVMEGVETDAALAQLQAMGCDVVQGFLFSKPLPPAELQALLGPAPGRPELAPPAAVAASARPVQSVV